MPRSIITMNGQCSGTGRFLLPEKRASAVIPLRRGSNADSRVHGGKDGRWCSREKQEGREEEGVGTDYAEGERRKAPTPRPLPQGQRVMAGAGAWMSRLSSWDGSEGQTGVRAQDASTGQSGIIGILWRAPSRRAFNVTRSRVTKGWWCAVPGPSGGIRQERLPCLKCQDGRFSQPVSQGALASGVRADLDLPCPRSLMLDVE